MAQGEGLGSGKLLDPGSALPAGVPSSASLPSFSTQKSPHTDQIQPVQGQLTSAHPWHTWANAAKLIWASCPVQ